MRIDVHCHIGQRCRPCADEGRFSFEPAGRYAPFDAYISDRLFNSLGMRLVRRLLGAPRRAAPAEVDGLMEAYLLKHILAAGQVDRVVLLAFDQNHSASGVPLGPRGRGNRFGSDLYVSNTYIRQLWQRYPRRILFGASIHPYRTAGGMNALDMLAEVAAAGAVLVKWLPPTHHIDPRDPRTIAFLRRAAELGMPLLIHGGAEFTLGNLYPRFGDPRGWLDTLRILRRAGQMPTVIIAHAATPLFWPVTPGRTFYTLIEALTGEFADAPLYADIAALALFSKAHWLKKLLAMPAVQSKLVYGSDFPIPPTPLFFRGRLGRRYRPIADTPSMIDRDVMIKSALGIADEVLTRGSVLLKERIACADALAGLV